MLFRTIVRRAHTQRKNFDLKGIFVPLTTPFKQDETICYNSLKFNLDKYEKIPFSGYCVSGTNGEAPYLNFEEKVNLVKFVKNNTDGQKIIIGGCSAESTKITCEMSREMAVSGADAILVMPPFYFKKRMTDEAILAHFNAVADSCDIPVIIYNNPWVTGIDISTPILAQLAKHPNIRGVKDSDVRKCAGTVKDTKKYNFDIVAGSAGYLLGSMLNGASGGINGLANILGNEVCNLYNLIISKRFDEARQLQIQLSKPDSLLLGEMGVPGVKAAMEMKGYTGGKCRLPLLPVTEHDKTRISSALKDAAFL